MALYRRSRCARGESPDVENGSLTRDRAHFDRPDHKRIRPSRWQSSWAVRVRRAASLVASYASPAVDEAVRQLPVACWLWLRRPKGAPGIAFLVRVGVTGRRTRTIRGKALEDAIPARPAAEQGGLGPLPDHPAQPGRWSPGKCTYHVCSKSDQPKQTGAPPRAPPLPGLVRSSWSPARRCRSPAGGSAAPPSGPTGFPTNASNTGVPAGTTRRRRPEHDLDARDRDRREEHRPHPASAPPAW